jgi:hypothetical protein
MSEMGRDGDVEGLSRLLDEGVDPTAPEECHAVSVFVCVCVCVCVCACVSHG